MTQQTSDLLYLAGCGCAVCELAEWFQLPRWEVIQLLRRWG